MELIMLVGEISGDKYVQPIFIIVYSHFSVCYIGGEWN